MCDLVCTTESRGSAWMINSNASTRKQTKSKQDIVAWVLQCWNLISNSNFKQVCTSSWRAKGLLWCFRNKFNAVCISSWFSIRLAKQVFDALLQQARSHSAPLGCLFSPSFQGISWGCSFCLVMPWSILPTKSRLWSWACTTQAI